MFIARHIKSGRREPGVGRSREVKVFPVFVEGGILRVAHAISDLKSLALIERIYKHRMQAARQLPGVRDPFTIRSPGLAELRRGEAPVVIGIDKFRSRIGEIHIPQIQSLIRISYLLAVGRPRGSIEK